MARSSQALTLVEIVLATVLLAFGMLGVVSVLTWGTIGARHSSRATQALNYARELTEVIRVRQWAFAPPAGLVDLLPSDRQALDATPFNDPTINLPGNSNFQRNIQLTRLSNNSADWRYNVMVIQVGVFWTDQGAEHGVTLRSAARNQ